MILWLDAQLPPSLAKWISTAFGIETDAVRDVGLRDASDSQIFLAARTAGAVVMTKDNDFLRMLQVLGPPPQVLWVTSGNSSNQTLRAILERQLVSATALLNRGESMVEISDRG